VRELRGAILPARRRRYSRPARTAAVAAGYTRGFGITPPSCGRTDTAARLFQTAATALFDSHIPSKLGRQLTSKRGGPYGQAFSTKPPGGDAAAPLRGHPGWHTRVDQPHEGAMKLGQVRPGIRNPPQRSHRPGEQEALEMLAVLSYVARLLTRRKLVEAHTTPRRPGRWSGRVTVPPAVPHAKCLGGLGDFPTSGRFMFCGESHPGLGRDLGWRVAVWSGRWGLPVVCVGGGRKW